MSKIVNFTKKDIKHIARVSRIPLTKGELEYFVGQLATTLEYLETFQRLRKKLKKVQETHHVAGLKNALVEDNVNDCFSPKKALSNAPKKQRGYFQVLPIFKKE